MADFCHQLAVGQASQRLIELGLFGQRSPHLTEIPALDQRQAVLHNLLALPDVEQPLDVHARHHAVFAAVQCLSGEVETPVEAQPEGVLDHAIGLQSIKHTGRR